MVAVVSAELGHLRSATRSCKDAMEFTVHNQD